MLRDLFMTFGIPEELASDGCPEFTAAEMQKFLNTYDVHHRRSSEGNPHTNQRAEVGVKLDNDRFTRAILQYRNTPKQSTGMSPARELFGHQLRDFANEGQLQTKSAMATTHRSEGGKGSSEQSESRQEVARTLPKPPQPTGGGLRLQPEDAGEPATPLGQDRHGRQGSTARPLRRQDKRHRAYHPEEQKEPAKIWAQAQASTPGPGAAGQTTHGQHASTGSPASRSTTKHARDNATRSPKRSRGHATGRQAPDPGQATCNRPTITGTAHSSSGDTTANS